MQKQTKYNNGSINYTVNGSGNTLVLLHGFIGSLAIWDEFVKELQKQFQVICIDLPGHGATSVFSDTHTMDFMADCVNHILEVEHIDECVMIGHSMGGYVSLTFAENYPDKLAGFGLFHSHASPDSEQKKKDRNQVIRIVAKRPDIVVAEMLPKLFANEDITPYPDEEKKLSSIANTMSSEAISAALAGMRDREDKEHVLSFTNVPVLYILGQQDPVIDYNEVKHQLELNEYIVPLVMPKVGHMGFIEDFPTTINAVKEFVKTCFE